MHAPDRAVEARRIADELAALPAPQRAARVAALQDVELRRVVEVMIDAEPGGAASGGAAPGGAVPDDTVPDDAKPGDADPAAPAGPDATQLAPPARPASAMPPPSSSPARAHARARDRDGDRDRTTDPATSPLGGIVIPGFHVVRRLGHGAMGAVYEAEQTSLGRRVAIKLLRSTDPDPSTVQRFEREATALARVTHPAVARIYETGEVDGGRGPEPYIVMELVHGRTLDAWCRASPWDLATWLELFARICDGVQAAHDVGVVHRDLKPANIIVDEDDQPRILDFGVARLACDAAVSEQVSLTHGGVIGTLAYMSPEQAAGGSTAVDVRSDVYALGVILFEMVSGRLPLEVDRQSIVDTLRRIRESDRATLSTVTERGRGDLDTIVGCALAVEPDRRYARAADLAADVRRMLRHEPIEARRPTAMYRATKFVRRHRTLVGFTTLLVLVLMTAVVVVTGLYLEAEGQRQDATRAARQAQAVSDFLLDDLLDTEQLAALGYEATLLDVLEVTAPRIDERFEDEPLLASDLNQKLARIHQLLGARGEAVAFAERALDQRRAADGETTRAVLDAWANLVSRLFDAGRIDDAARELDRFRAAAEARGPVTPGSPNDDLMLAIEKLDADLLAARGDFEGAVETLESVIAARTDRFGPDDVSVYAAYNGLGSYLLRLQRFDEAEIAIRREVEGYSRLRSPTDPGVLASMNNLGSVLRVLGRPEEADIVFVDLIDRMRRLTPSGSWYIGAALYNRGVNLVDSGNLDAGARTLEEAADVFDEHAEPSDYMFQQMMLRLAVTHLDRSDADAAMDVLDRLTRLQDAGGPHDLLEYRLERQFGVVKLLIDTDRVDEAIQRAEAAVEQADAGVESPRAHAMARLWLGEARAAGGDRAGARAAFDAVLAMPDAPAVIVDRVRSNLAALDG